MKQKAELAKLAGEKQLIFFFFLTPSLFLFPTHSPGSHGSVVFSRAPDSLRLSGLWGSYQWAEPDALSLGSWLLSVLYLFCLFPHKRSAGLLAQTHRRDTLCPFLFSNIDKKNVKKEEASVSSLGCCVPAIKSMTQGKKKTPAMAPLIPFVQHSPGFWFPFYCIFHHAIKWNRVLGTQLQSMQHPRVIYQMIMTSK